MYVVQKMDGFILRVDKVHHKVHKKWTGSPKGVSQNCKPTRWKNSSKNNVTGSPRRINQKRTKSMGRRTYHSG